MKLNIETFRIYCLNKANVTEEFPFDENTLVFKVGGKMFALANVVLFESINVKCDPEKAILLREQYPCVIPGYHMNKRHWNTILIDHSVPDQLICEWIDDSYHLVAKKLSKKRK